MRRLVPDVPSTACKSLGYQPIPVGRSAFTFFPYHGCCVTFPSPSPSLAATYSFVLPFVAGHWNRLQYWAWCWHPILKFSWSEEVRGQHFEILAPSDRLRSRLVFIAIVAACSLVATWFYWSASSLSFFGLSWPHGAVFRNHRPYSIRFGLRLTFSTGPERLCSPSSSRCRLLRDWSRPRWQRVSQPDLVLQKHWR